MRTSVRYGMLLPLALLIASLATACLSFSNARQSIADDLNEAIIALANENSELWTRPDTIAALRQMHETTHKPMIFQASDLEFRNAALKDEAFFSLALVDKNYAAPKIQGSRIASDSVMLVAQSADVAVRVQGFANCSMASVFAASDQTLPGVLFTLSLLSMASMLIWHRRETPALSLDNIKLTPMQKQLTQLLLTAPGMRLDKATICSTLWGNKSNAEESLYTLVRRTKSALAAANIEIICNRGESYELRINS